MSINGTYCYSENGLNCLKGFGPNCNQEDGTWCSNIDRINPSFSSQCVTLDNRNCYSDQGQLCKSY
jgi:hypothetical protein